MDHSERKQNLIVQSQTQIELRSLVKRFKRVAALDNLCLRINRGERLTLTGPSGCGKTTALRLIAGLEVPDDGKITIAGQLASSAKRLVIQPQERHISMLFQDLGLWPNLSVAANIMLGLTASRLSRSDKNSKIKEISTNFGLDQLLRRKPGTLSAGQQQRVSLARALVGEPETLLLDEPFAALDLETKDEMQSYLRKDLDQRNPTLILVSHDPAEAIALDCKRVIVVRTGKVAADAPLKRGAFSGSEDDQLLARWISQI